ncbi:hypothetical protein EGT07_02630 [Herbaspirillum sp. HC18]|nr:hypothetical protein EGT07_02630 [Herbaspirillum sp. HC18]
MFFLRCPDAVCSPWKLAGTGPGGPLTFFASPKKVSKERGPPRCDPGTQPPAGVPEKMRSKAGSEITRPHCVRCSDKFRFPPCVPFFRGPPQGAACQGRLFGLPFWRSKKVSGPPGPVPASIYGEQTEPGHRRETHCHPIFSSAPNISSNLTAGTGALK